MLNRRFLRIKVFQALYALSREEQPNVQLQRKRLQEGLDKTYELMVFLLSFPEALVHFLEQDLEAQKSKYIPSAQQVTQLETLLSNRVLKQLAENTKLQALQKQYKVSWTGSADVLRAFWNSIREQEWLKVYMAKNNHSYAEERDLIATLFELVLSDEELFYTFIEDRYANWEDDQVLVLTTLQRLFKDLKESTKELVPAKHKDEAEELTFMKDLFNLYLQHETELSALVTSRTRNWEEDRIALVDLILMRMALCELLYFHTIPVKVTINEYLELAKLYSTPQSHGFINGILDKAQQELKAQGKIEKRGRGLVD